VNKKQATKPNPNPLPAPSAASALPASPPESVLIGSQVKFLDGKWYESGAELPDGTQLIVLGVDQILQRWSGGQVVDTNRDLDMLDELNGDIPRTEWELGVNGKPREPWVRTYVVHLIDPSSGARFTFATASIGGAIAVRNLRDCIAGMKQLRGGVEAAPLIELGSKPMRTRFSPQPRPRPHFQPVAWQGLGGETPKLAAPVKPAEPDDQIPF
jgi:hypothetical protein